MTPNPSAQLAHGNGALYLLFSLGADRYALDVREVVQVMPLRRLKTLPEAPDWVAGVFDYRGVAVPVIDLAVRACGRPAAILVSTRLVLVNYPLAGRVLGLILEQATNTRRLAPDAFFASGLDSTEAPYLGPLQNSAQGLLQRIEVAGLLTDEMVARLFPPAGEAP